MKMFVLTIMAVMSMASGVRAEEGQGEGERLYVKYCSGCHKLTDQTSKGPGFQGVTGRRTEAWIDKWLQNPKAMIESGDADAVMLKEKYRIAMPAIKIMADDKARREIINFLKENDKKVAQ
ncbi:MAG: cytochrome c [Nitrospinae bacterium]|nr:cytochrome c [Nitrospinota bacterium]